MSKWATKHKLIMETQRKLTVLWKETLGEIDDLQYTWNDAPLGYDLWRNSCADALDALDLSRDQMAVILLNLTFQSMTLEGTKIKVGDSVIKLLSGLEWEQD